MDTTTNETAVPIREISRLTGVNSVTLRAWERRYGLLKPTRTNKGHRLYSRDDIQRVKAIQAWLVRGLAIGKVRAVLAEDHVIDEGTYHDNVWQGYAAQLASAVQDLNRRKLEGLLSELISIYPLEAIADQLIAPAIEMLQQNRYANSTRREFLARVVAEHIYPGQQRQRQAAFGVGVMVIKLNAGEGDELPLILNRCLLINGYKSEYLRTIPTEEWVFAAEQLQPQLIILYSDSASRLAEVKQQSARWEELLQVPLLISGKLTTLLAVPPVSTHENKIQSHLLASDIQQTIAQLLLRFPIRH